MTMQAKEILTDKCWDECWFCFRSWNW